MPLSHKELCELSECADRFGIRLDESTLGTFSTYADLLAEWNEHTNLVSRRDMGRLVPYHFLDSLKVASVLDMASITRLLDFGSGAGFPGIPLAIAFPSMHVTLVDNRRKRYTFLDTAVRSLSLDNAISLHSSIDTLPSNHDTSYDCVVTRATRSLNDFRRSCHRFVRGTGVLVAIKGDDVKDELSRLRDVSGSFINIVAVHPDTPANVRSGTIVIMSNSDVVNNPHHS